MRLGAEDDGASDTLESFLGKLKAFGTQEATATADVSTGGGASKLLALSTALQKFARTRAVATAQVNVDDRGLSQLDAAFKRSQLILPVEFDDNKLRSDMGRSLSNLQDILRRRKLEVEPEVNSAGFIAELSSLDVLLKSFGGRREVKLDLDTNKMALGAMVMGKLASSMAGGVNTAQRLGGAIGGITVNLGPFGVKLTAVTGIALALAAAVGISLVAALGLLVTALAGATAAVGAMATAFVGALGPIVTIAIATVARITKVVQALKAKNEAEKAGAAGSEQARALEERRHDAIVAVGRALRSVESAERGLAQARDAARDAIVQANRDEQAAAEATAQTAQEVASTMRDAFRAMSQAAEDVRDTLLAIEGGEIGVEKSKIASERAQNALAKLRGEANLTGAELSKAFNKFTDVDFDFDVKDLDSILKGPGGGKTSQDQALDLKDAILDVREAKLNEKLANDRLQDSEQDLIDKRKVAADFAQKGIAAYAPYTAAVTAHKDATQRLADATARANELEQQGVDNAPTVIAAHDALINANESLAEARRNSRNLATQAAGGEAARKAKEDWDALTAAEQAFGRALQATGIVLRNTFGGAIAGVLGGMTAGLKKMPGVLLPLGPAFTKLGEAIGATISGFVDLLAEPRMQDAFKALIAGATQLVKILGGRAFQAFFEIMVNLAVAAMPLLVASSKLFAGWLERIAKRTRDPEKMGHAMADLGDIFFGVLGLVKQLGRIFLNFFKATGTQSKGFIATLTGMAKGFADFLGSEEGRAQVKKFFEDVIPLAIEGIKFIGNFIVFVLQLVETIAPALTGLLKTFNLVFGVVNRVLGIFKPFLKVAAQIALLFLGGLPKAVGVFLSKFRLLAPIGAFLTRHIVGVVTAIIGRISAIASFFPKAFDKVKDEVLDFISWIGRQFKKVIDVITWPFEQAIKFITDLSGRFYEAGKGIVEAIIEGMKSLIEGIGGIAGKVFKFLVDKLPGSEPKDKSSPLYGLKDRGRAIMENIAAGIQPGAMELSLAVHRSLVPVVAGIDASVSVPRTAAPTATPAGATTTAPGPTINHWHIEAPAGALPDAEATARAIARRMERSSGGSPRA